MFLQVILAAALTVDLCPVPAPVSFRGDMDHPVAFDTTTTVTVECPDAAAVPWLRAHFAEWFSPFEPQVASGALALALRPGEEAYAVKADASGVRIKARTLAGVRWAAYSIRQLAIAKRGKMTVRGRMLPAVEMSDSPRLRFRAVHLCWFPETRVRQIERAIRLAALLKFNFVVLESWGVWRSERHQWWGWPDGAMTKERVKGLVALGRDLGVTLIPQINVFGHGTLSRTLSLKNAVLDLRPEYEPLFEPGGWNWCLTNPETQRILRELIVEMHEDFGNPPYFHLGCDEAQPPACPECRTAVYGELVRRHIADLAKFVSKRGAKAMIWHDMLLERNDPRWKGFVACGDAETAKLAEQLPKDVVICDWQYGDGARTNWPTLAYFAEKGFPVAGCPWMNYGAMQSMSGYLAKIGAFGYVQTTWSRLDKTELVGMFRHGSAAAWGTPPSAPAAQFDTAFGIVLRLVGQDMKATDPADTGNVAHQIPPESCLDN